jgi:hypothetical protein
MHILAAIGPEMIEVIDHAITRELRDAALARKDRRDTRDALSLPVLSAP